MTEPEPHPSPSFYHLVERGRRAQRYFVLLALGVVILSLLAWVQWRAIARFAKASKEDYVQEVRGFAPESSEEYLSQSNRNSTNTPAELGPASSLQGAQAQGSQAKDSQGKDSQAKDSQAQAAQGQNSEPREGELEANQDASASKEPVSFYRYRVNPNNFVVEPLLATDEKKTGSGAQTSSRKLFLITIDDAPDDHMLDLAKACSEAGVKAIFFVNGFFLKDKAQVAAVKKVLAMGHSIGNHSHSHSKLTLLSYEEQKKEIVDFNLALEDALGVRPRFFRPPFGEYSADTLQICAEAGLTLLNWTYGYDDLSAYDTPEALTKITLESPHLSSGATLVFHDRPNTAKAMPDILRGLLDMGYQSVDPAFIASDSPGPAPEE